ncbi:kynurenine formamidase-like isoform X2 [Halichondria panicea]|uniref:kynurenine formamidase-like isoform X2 n=1 Tax=Halichondria panicea TaxID=6063 RepID=UPI00312B9703
MADAGAVDINSHSRAELDTLYSPSCWSKKLNRDVIVDNHLKVITEATEKVRAQTKNTLSVVYGDKSSNETLDIYYPCHECPDEQSLVIVIHGGYWTFLEKDNYGYMSLPLVKQGITTAVINFDNAPKGTMTTIVEQCRRACHYIAQAFPNKKLYLIGHSAGAHLCACMLSTDWSSLGLNQLAVHGAILVSGIYDLYPIRRCCVNEPLNLTESEVMEYSPQRNIPQLKANVCAELHCLLCYGEQESPEFKRQSQEFHQGVVSVGVSSNVCEVEDEDHFTVIERLVEEQFSVTKHILQLIKS